MPELTTKDLAELIADKLTADRQQLQARWNESGPVRHVSVENLLDPDLTDRIAASFPQPDQLLLRNSLRERKRVGVEVDKYPPLAGAALYAFQQPVVIEAVREITGHRTLVGDPSLYAAGLSVMSRGDFLGIHIDNSHDGDGQLYRALNLLFYVSPDWRPEDGGSLQLWDRKVRQPDEVHAIFNRLVIMETDQTSWHSVTPITGDAPRRCVSNYLFSPEPPKGRPYRHVTTFTARPDEPLKRALLFATDRVGLNTVARLAPGLVKRTKHRISTDVEQGDAEQA